MKMLYYVIVLFSAFVLFTDKDRCKGIATEHKIHSIEFSCLIYLYPDSFSQNPFFFSPKRSNLRHFGNFTFEW